MSQFFAWGGQSIGSFSFSISPSNEHLGLISFRIDWLDILAVHIYIYLFSSLEKEKHCRSLTFKSIARAEMNSYKSTTARTHRFVQNVEVISEFD